MSTESAKAFLDRIQTDDAFRAKVEAAKDKDARIAVVKAAGFDFELAELHATRAELSDEMLEKVVGGQPAVSPTEVVP